MYREKIDKFIDAHKTEMLEDIAELCKIDSTKDSYRAGRAYGDGCFEALGAALHIAECYGFSINNYDNYVGTVDLNDKEKQLDILAHLDIVPAGDGWTVTEPFVPVVKDGKIIEQGRHLELLEKKGYYYQLVRRQFTEEESQKLLV